MKTIGHPYNKKEDTDEREKPTIQLAISELKKPTKRTQEPSLEIKKTG